MNPSAEQQFIIDHVKQSVNVVVDACAGSGKSTTILSAARQIPEKRFIQIAYSKMLRHEVLEKTVEYQLTNMAVHTFHSLAYHFYHTDGQMDNGMRRIIREKMAPKRDLPVFDVLVIDEAQDMTKLYFQFLVKMLTDGGRPVQLMILGDKKQGLYEFKGADVRFLTMSEPCWRGQALHSPEFVYCTLHMSYRITNPMASFVNQVMLAEPRLLAQKPGAPVVYVRKERYTIAKIIVAQIKTHLALGAALEDFYILCGSPKGAFIKQIENRLVEENIPCYLSSDTEQLDNRTMTGKVVFATFHAVKGRQRKYVFVLGFNETYFTYFARTLPTDTCPNTLYVACTRATDKLFVFENCGEDGPLPFLQMSHSTMMKQDFMTFQGLTQGFKTTKKENKEAVKYCTSPTELLKFLSEDTLDTISGIVDRMFIRLNPETGLAHEDQTSEQTFLEIPIPTIKETSTGFEDVSDLNGIVLPILFYERFGNSTLLQDLVRANMNDIPAGKHGFLHEMVAKMPAKCVTPDDYLFTANLGISTQEKVYSKLKQIPAYDWLSPSIIEDCMRRLEEVVGEVCRTDAWVAEKTILHQSNDLDHANTDRFFAEYFPQKFRFTARVDFMTKEALWEMKCTANLTIEHKLQLVIYMWIQNMVEPGAKKGYLFNVKSGEWLQMVYTMSELSTIMLAIVKDKFKDTVPKSDEAFLAELA